MVGLQPSNSGTIERIGNKHHFQCWYNSWGNNTIDISFSLSLTLSLILEQQNDVHEHICNASNEIQRRLRNVTNNGMDKKKGAVHWKEESKNEKKLYDKIIKCVCLMPGVHWSDDSAHISIFFFFFWFVTENNSNHDVEKNLLFGETRTRKTKMIYYSFLHRHSPLLAISGSTASWL